MPKLKTLNLKRIIVTIAAPGQAQPISDTAIFVSDFEFYMVAANAGANMYIGDETVDNTWIPRPKGTSYKRTAGDGTFLGTDAKLGFDLSQLYVDADAAGDKMIVEYVCGKLKG